MKKYFLFFVILTIVASCSNDKSDDKKHEVLNKQKAVSGAKISRQIFSEKDRTNGLKPEDIAAKFINASNTKDKKKLETVLTKKAYECVSTGKFTDRDFLNFKIKSAVFKDDKAYVPVAFSLKEKRTETELVMRKEDGKWRIHAFKEKNEEGVDITIDMERLCDFFENASTNFKKSFSDYDKNWIAEKKSEYKALKEVDPKKFNSDWQLDINIEDKTVQEAIETLIRPLGLSLFTCGFEQELSKKITFHKKKISRLQVIEIILNELGLYPVYPDISMGGLREFGTAITDSVSEMFVQSGGPFKMEKEGKTLSTQNIPSPNSLLVKRGPRPYPIVFTGPIMIEIEKVVEKVPLATGLVSIIIWGADINKSALVLLKESEEAAMIEDVVDSKGASLLLKKTEGYFSHPEIQGSMFRLAKTVLLKGLYNSVQEIRMISGAVMFETPVKVSEEKVSLKDMKKKPNGVELSFGTLRFFAKFDGSQSRFDIKGPSGLLKKFDIRFYPVDANNAFIGPFSLGTSYSFSTDDDTMPGNRIYSLPTEEEPAHVFFKFLTETNRIEYPFEIKKIPLKSFQKMPEGIVALDFKGCNTPVSIGFVKFDRKDAYFPKAIVKLKNHSNKNILKIETEFEYLDEKGDKLKTFPQNVEGALTMDFQEPVVNKKAEKEIEATAFFLPENAVDLNVRVKGVEFEDFSWWHALVITPP